MTARATRKGKLPDEDAPEERIGATPLINQPRPILVRTAADHLPQFVKMNDGWARVVEIVDRWRVDDLWWTEHPVQRMWFELQLDGHRRLTLWYDLKARVWYRQRWDAPVRMEGPFGALTEPGPPAVRETDEEALAKALAGATAAAEAGWPLIGWTRLRGAAEAAVRSAEWTGDTARAARWREALAEFGRRWLGDEGSASAKESRGDALNRGL